MPERKASTDEAGIGWEFGGTPGCFPKRLIYQGLQFAFVEQLGHSHRRSSPLKGQTAIRVSLKWEVFLITSVLAHTHPSVLVIGVKMASRVVGHFSSHIGGSWFQAGKCWHEQWRRR